jgi:hypothetical protein
MSTPDNLLPRESRRSYLCRRQYRQVRIKIYPHINLHGTDIRSFSEPFACRTRYISNASHASSLLGCLFFERITEQSYPASYRQLKLFRFLFTEREIVITVEIY